MESPAAVRRPLRLGPRGRVVFDIAVGVVVVVPSLTAVAYNDLNAFAINLGQTVPLLVRRRFPRAVFAVVAAVSGLQALVYDYPLWGQVAFPVAVYSLARYGPGRWGRVGLAVGVLASAVAAWVWTRGFNLDMPAEYQQDLSPGDYLPYFLLCLALVVAAWATGAQATTREAYEEALLERGERLALEAEQRAVMAAADERARIAREMHDVVAHGLSVVIVQADGARYAAEHDPAVAARTLETIAATGRASLDEMRRLLGLLRGTTSADLLPQPRLGDLPDLLAPEVAAGAVEARLPDPLPQVSDGVALTVYRVVQESLSNVRKHAGPGARAVVTLTHGDGAVTVEITDDGRGAMTAAARAQGPGLGLLGMRERVDVHGGRLTCGPVPGGWRVHARIPS